MNIQRLSVEAALDSLHSSIQGLTREQAALRLAEYGFNVISGRARREFFSECLTLLVAQFTHFFAILLWVAAGISWGSEWLNPGQGMGALGFAIVLVILLNGVFAFWQEFRANRALRSLAALLPVDAVVIREGEHSVIPAENLVPGDLVRLESGGRVPADCRIISTQGIVIDESALTGESIPRLRGSEPDFENDPGIESWRSRNVALAGTWVMSGEATGAVYATGLNTEFGRLAKLSRGITPQMSPLQREIGILSKRIAIIAMVIGVTFFWLGARAGLSKFDNLLFVIGIIVANVPEGLMPTVTLALALAAQRMAKKKALVRHLPAVEALGAVTTICTDKTGTLTQNIQKIRESWALHDGRLERLDETRDPRFLRVVLNCHELEPTVIDDQRQWRGNPLEVELQKHFALFAPEVVIAKIGMLPFEASRRRLTTLHALGNVRYLLTKGAVEAVLPLCVLPSASSNREIEIKVEHMASAGLRVLALAEREWNANGLNPDAESLSRLENNMSFVGLIGLADPPRQEVPEAIAKCKSAGVRVVMVTGDHPVTAVAIGRQIGLIERENPVVVTGAEMRNMTASQLQLALSRPEVLFARVDSTQKLDIVQALQNKGQIVAMTGDGINDAPALKKADIGVAMGARGTDVARESADLILLDDNFATIVHAIEEGRTVFLNIRKFLTYILTSNVPELVPYLLAVLFRIPLPLTILLILAVDLGTDLLPALALGAEVPTGKEITAAPRPKNERLANRRVFLRSYLYLGVGEALAAMSVYGFVLLRGGWRYGERLAPASLLYREAITGCFVAIVVMQIANLMICRSETDSIFARRHPRNSLLLWGVGFELLVVFGIAYTAVGNRVFQTAPIGTEVWLAALPFAIGLVMIEELRKWSRRGAGIKKSCHPYNKPGE